MSRASIQPRPLKPLIDSLAKRFGGGEPVPWDRDQTSLDSEASIAVARSVPAASR